MLDFTPSPFPGVFSETQENLTHIVFILKAKIVDHAEFLEATDLGKDDRVAEK